MTRPSLFSLLLLLLISSFLPFISVASESYSSNTTTTTTLPRGVIRCDACKFLIKLVQDVEEGRVTREVGESVATSYCEINHGGLGYTCEGTWQCKDVCSGAVDEFAPIVLEVSESGLGEAVGRMRWE